MVLSRFNLSAKTLVLLCLLTVSLMSADSKMGEGHEYDDVDIKVAVAMKTALPVQVAIDESRVVAPFRKELLGYNYTWVWLNEMTLSKDATDGKTFSPQHLKLMQGMSIPLARVSGGGSKTFQWKHAIGPFSQRKPHPGPKWMKPKIQKVGHVEWIKSVLATDPNARFSITFNIDVDSTEDCVDLVEFLIGDPAKNPNGGMNWAAKRVELGLEKPVDVAVWEIGSEVDWSETRSRWPIEKYIAKCKDILTSVKKDFPHTTLAAHAATAFSSKIHEKNGGWSVWHRQLLKAIGHQIDMIAIHPYYHFDYIAKLERDCVGLLAQDIKDITGSDRVKIFVSEHAKWPRQRPHAKWSESWYETHSLAGSLCTAQWINRMLNTPAVTMMTYHSFSGGPWGMVYLNKTQDKLYTTGVFDVFKLLNTIPGINVVQNVVSGKRTNTNRNTLSFTATALTTAEGLDLILVNSEPEVSRQVTFTFNGQYALTKIQTLSAPHMDSYNTLQKRPITVTEKNVSQNNPFTQYNLPAKSLVLLRLKKVK